MGHRAIPEAKITGVDHDWLIVLALEAVADVTQNPN
jgi:hypothetical protein